MEFVTALNKTILNALLSHINSLRNDDQDEHRKQDIAIEKIDKRVSILEEKQRESAPGESGS